VGEVMTNFYFAN